MRERTAVVFDLDDTLYRERRFALGGYAAVAHHVARRTGIPAATLYRFLASRFRRHGREGLLQALCAAFALPARDIPSLVDVLRAHRPRLTLPRRSRDVLVALRAHGHRLGIVTNGLPEIQARKVAALGIEALVDTVVYAQHHAPDGKPAPVCFAVARERLDVEAAHTVFVGDHPVKDIDGATAAGLHAIWLPGARLVPAPAVACAYATSLAEVPALVAHLLEAQHVAAC